MATGSRQGQQATESHRLNKKKRKEHPLSCDCGEVEIEKEMWATGRDLSVPLVFVPAIKVVEEIAVFT